jgi:hypothetical protein
MLRKFFKHLFAVKTIESIYRNDFEAEVLKYRNPRPDTSKNKNGTYMDERLEDELKNWCAQQYLQDSQW